MGGFEHNKTGSDVSLLAPRGVNWTSVKKELAHRGTKSLVSRGVQAATGANSTRPRQAELGLIADEIDRQRPLAEYGLKQHKHGH